MQWVVPFLLLSFSTTLPAQGFEEEFAAADLLAAAGDYGAARARLLAAFGDDAERGPVLARIGAVQERLADWAFAATLPDPGPAELLHGEVKSWKDKRLQIHLIYDWAKLDDAARAQDFQRAGNAWLFAVPLQGDLKLTLNGEWIAGADGLEILVGSDAAAAETWRFMPGFKRTKVLPVLMLPRRAERIGGRHEIFHTSTEDLEEPASTWAYTVELRQGTFTFKLGNKKIGSWKTAYPELAQGFLGFRGGGVKGIDFSAELDPTAWELRRSELIERRRKDFRRSYDPAAELPAWYGELQARSAAATSFRPPDGIPADAAAAWAELLDPDQQFEIATWCEQRGLGRAPAAYAAAVRHATLGEWEACARATDEAAKLGLPEFGPALELRARAAFQLNQPQRAIEDLAQALPAWPDDAGYARARLSGRQFGPRRMLQALDEAVAAGGLSERVLRTRRALQEVLEGPTGREPQRFAGSVLHISSDADQEFVQGLGRSGVAALSWLTRTWGQLRQPKEPLLVLHFSQEGTRQAFCRRAGLPEDAAGYVPEIRCSLVVLDPEKVDLEQPGALFAALWPQLLDATVDVERAPRWFVSGFAGVLAGCQVVGPGIELHANLPLLDQSAENEAGWFFTARQLVTLPHADWDEHDHWAVPESYLLLRYLWAHSPPEQQSRFQAYATALFQGKSRAEAYDALFGQTDLVALTAALVAFRQEELARR